MVDINVNEQLRVAIAAVRQAVQVCRAIQGHMVCSDQLQKKDFSPVTVADFASQAVICAALEASSVVKGVMAEESAVELRKDESVVLRANVVRQVRSVLGQTVTEARVLDLIDRGAWRFRAPPETYWTLDPVDGTKGFLRSGHYAIALALVNKGKVVLGVLACPTLQFLDGSRGALATAARGQGTRLMSLDSGATGVPLRVADVNDLSVARLCESFEPGHSDQVQSAEVAARLGLSLPALRIDSQVKYAALASGRASIYLRIPKRNDYLEKIWDHAAGVLIVEEAGGIVTDVAGKPFDFSQGETLKTNWGIVASSPNIHDKVLKTVRAVTGKC